MSSFLHDPMDTGGETVADGYERLREEEYQAHREARDDARLDRKRDYSPDPKPEKRASRKEANRGVSIDWKIAVLDRDQGCRYHANPAECREGWIAHHCLPQQLIRRQFPELLWATRLGMGLCGEAHRQFHSGHITITREMVPDTVQGFIEGLGYGWYLDKHYPRQEQEAAA